MSHFNLIDEKWIPVRHIDGNREEFGIREALLRSKEISEIENDSPLVVAALYRFLLALLYRALEGPTDIDKAKALFRAGIPHGKIESYLEKWRDRFWLFDEKYPFWQVPDLKLKKLRSWTVLATEFNDDNSKVLFDHADVRDPGSISAAASARWLIATQAFSIGKGRAELGYTSSAPSATGVIVIPVGRNLEDTLMFLLVPQSRLVFEADSPVWEKDPETVAYLMNDPERDISGFADLYSWRARSVLLERDPSGGVSGLAFSSGIRPKRSSDRMDPMLAYRRDEKLGILPMQFKERGLWRDFDSLLPDESHNLSPKVIDNAAEVGSADQDRFPSSVMVFGQANDKAKIEFWRMERFALPGVLAGKNNLRADIQRFLLHAEDVQRSLWAAAAGFARDILSHDDQRTPAKEDVRKFVAQMPCMARYWSVLESKFHEVLQSFSMEADSELIELEWRQAVVDALDEAWRGYRISVSAGDAWTIRALARAEGKIAYTQKKLITEISESRKQFKQEET